MHPIRTGSTPLQALAIPLIVGMLLLIVSTFVR